MSEALIAFRRENGLDAKYAGMSEEAQAQFERHDIIHVLFGLTTNLRDEAKADGWTLLGSDVSWREIREFTKLPEEQEIVSEIGWRGIVKAIWQALPDYASMLWRARRLNKRWPWSGNESYRSQRVSAIRKEFGIDAALR
ncbi:MAG: hypothetical protein AAFY81_00865 [Pseudomonadota bacterium]